MKKLLITAEEYKQIRELLPTLLELQRIFRGLTETKPEYREAKYAEVWQEDGLPLVLDYAFIKFLRVFVDENLTNHAQR